MPNAIPRACRKFGCYRVTDSKTGYCFEHRSMGLSRRNYRAENAKRPKTTERGYGYGWQKARKNYLLFNPYCVICAGRGVYVTATVVDHIIPHDGHAQLFWDRRNWQALCKPCHDSKTAHDDRLRRREAN